MSDILSLNRKPLKYFITKNKNVINSPISDNGALIVYEGNEIDSNQPYRELWVSNYFLASGYGAKSREEQDKLSDIAANYDNSYLNLNYRIDETIDDLNSLYNKLNNEKVSKGSYSYNGDDISFNTFNFGENTIQLNDLYDKLQNIHVLYKFEITNVDYKIKLSDNNWYNNFSEVPVGTSVKEILISIEGNTRDSGGIKDIQIVLNNKKNGTIQEYVLQFKNFSANTTLPTLKNQKFKIDLYKTFYENDNSLTEYTFTIDNNILKNEIFKNIIIITNPTSVDNTAMVNNLLPSETIDDILNKFPSYFISSNVIYCYAGNISGINNGNNYKNILINKSNTYELTISNTDLFQYIALLIPNKNNVNNRLIKAEYYDNINHQIYDITDFIVVEFNVIINTQLKDIRYFIKVENNSNYNPNANPPFLHLKDNNLYFNEGKIVFTFDNSGSNLSEQELKLKNTNQYWISYNSSNNRYFPL